MMFVSPPHPEFDRPRATDREPQHLTEALIPHWVPADVREHLDVAELAGRNAIVEAERWRLERALGLFIAAYRAGVDLSSRSGRQLCSLFEAAPLTAAQLCHLIKAEARLEGVVFVAYASPLRRR